MKLWHFLALLLLAAGAAGAYTTCADRVGAPGAPARDEADPRGSDPAADRAGGAESRRSAGAEGEGAGAAPGSPEESAFEHNERGVRALREGDVGAAIEAFELALALAPDEVVHARNLAEALARRARSLRDGGAALEEALPLLARAAGLVPERADLAELLARWRREADVESEFSEFLSPYFHLSFDGSRSELLNASQRFLDRLEAGYTDLREWFAHDPVLEGRPPFPVRLYRRDEFERLTGLGHGVAGAFDGTIRLPLEEETVSGGRWDGTLRHELVHAFVREVGGDDVPGWLHEGLAQWLEGDAAAQVRAARERLAGGPSLPLEELERPLVTARDEERVRRAYDQSLVLVAHVARHYGDDVLLAMARAGADPAAAFERATGVPLATALEDALGGEAAGG